MPTSSASMGFAVYGEIALPSGYAQSGQYLAYGAFDSLSFGAVALTGTSGLGAPTHGFPFLGSLFTDAAVAPNNFGTIAQGQVVLADDKTSSSVPGAIDILGYNAAGVSIFGTMPNDAGAFGVAFAPSSFGAGCRRSVRVRR